MKKIATILFGAVCFIVGAITTIVIFLKTLLGIDSIRDSFIAALKKEITDNVYALFYGCKPKYKVKYQSYSNYYRQKDVTPLDIKSMHPNITKPLDLFGPYHEQFNELITVRSWYKRILDFRFNTYDEVIEVRDAIRGTAAKYGFVFVSDILDIFGTVYGYPDSKELEKYGWSYNQTCTELKVDGSHKNWRIKLPEPVKDSSRE